MRVHDTDCILLFLGAVAHSKPNLLLCHGTKRQAKEGKANSKAMAHGAFAKAKCQALPSALAQYKTIARDGTSTKQTLAQEKRNNHGIALGLFSYVSVLFLGATPD